MPLSNIDLFTKVSIPIFGWDMNVDQLKFFPLDQYLNATQITQVISDVSVMIFADGQPVPEIIDFNTAKNPAFGVLAGPVAGITTILNGGSFTSRTLQLLVTSDGYFKTSNNFNSFQTTRRGEITLTIKNETLDFPIFNP